MYNSDRRNSSRRSSQRMKDDYRKAEQEYVLPRNGLRTSIIIGLGGSILTLAIPIGITLAKASLFSQASRLDQSMPFQIAILAALWGGCGSVIVGLLMAFVVGVATGRITANSWLGIPAGAFPGACIPLYYIITAYIPGYPGHISSGTTTISLGGVVQGIIWDIVLIAALAIVGGLISWGGARIAIHRHPYYHSREQE